MPNRIHQSKGNRVTHPADVDKPNTFSNANYFTGSSAFVSLNTTTPLTETHSGDGYVTFTTTNTDNAQWSKGVKVQGPQSNGVSIAELSIDLGKATDEVRIMTGSNDAMILGRGTTGVVTISGTAGVSIAETVTITGTSVNTVFTATDKMYVTGLDWDVAASIVVGSGKTITAPNFVSNVAIGTSPYACTSTTLNSNLNSDLLDGLHAADIVASVPGAETDPIYSLNTYATGMNQGVATTDSPSFAAISATGASGVTLGTDAATNTAGSLKLWSAGANNWYTTFTAGTQTANATYTLPTAMPGTNNFPLICSTAGVLSWNDQAVLTTSTVQFAKVGIGLAPTYALDVTALYTAARFAMTEWSAEVRIGMYGSDVTAIYADSSSGACVQVEPSGTAHGLYIVPDSSSLYGIYTENACKFKLGILGGLLLGTAGEVSAITPVLGTLVYGDATPTWAALSGNATTTKKYLTQTGTGVVSAAPAWSTIAIGDIGALLSGTAPITYNSGTGAIGLDKTAAYVWTGTHKINVNSTTAFFVEQDGVKDNVFVVDTTNGCLGVNVAANSLYSTYITPAAAFGATGARLLQITDSGKEYSNTAGGNYAGIAGSVASASGVNMTAGFSLAVLSFIGTQNSNMAATTGTPELICKPVGITLQAGGTHTATVSWTHNIENAITLQDTSAYTGSGNTAINMNGINLAVESTSGLSGTSATVTSTSRGAYLHTALNYTAGWDWSTGTLNQTTVGADIELSDTHTVLLGTYTAYGVRVDINYTEASQDSNANLYAFYVDRVAVTDAGSFVGTKWAYYNATAVGNFMGLDNAKTYFGTGADASLYYDGTDLCVNTAAVGSGVLKLANATNWTANGTATITISNLGPAGIGTATISKWLTVKDDAGGVLYIPAWT